MGKNNRRDFIKTTGLIGAVSLIPFGKNMAQPEDEENDDCVLIPSETAGPFPLDLTTNDFYYRQDVREDRVGVQLNLKLRIIGNSNCEPMQNVRVNIWHCDKDGNYSGYNLPNNPGQAGKTYLRGYQYTDVNGEVEFVTIFPGWYNGRVCHIHFQVYVSSSYAAISQLTFDIESKQTLYTEHKDIYTKGVDPLTPSQDGIFADGYEYQVATLKLESNPDIYESFLEVTVKGEGTSSNGHIEKQNAHNFKLGQNSPNPYNGHTKIPFTLALAADVTLDLFDIAGRKVNTIQRNALPAGEHYLLIDNNEMNLPVANYVYQLSVHNKNGVFVDSKLMTAVK
jgi:protocatechuate 3,4-dioxygenase beta subunit